MRNEYSTPASTRSNKLSILRKVHHYRSVVREGSKGPPERIVVGKQAGHIELLARFVLLVAIYTFLLVAILASLDSAQHTNKAPGINFAYKVF